MRHGTVWTTTTIACAVLALGACNRKTAAREVQTTATVERSGDPVQLSGCLKSGVLADNTFVLLVSQKNGSGGTATYDVIPAAGVDLRDQIGQQVEVTGTLQGGQVASSEGAARESAPKGTSGTPTVETKTDVDIRRVAATSVKPIGAACQP
jgi:hypothetical protein